MRKIWWSWDIRMRWRPDFSFKPESFTANYRAAIDAAKKYGVEGIVIWGFLRDRHGGVDAAKRICEYADRAGVIILPGFGVDDYGGAYYEGESEYALDKYLERHPDARAVREDGTVFTHKWPPTDPGCRTICCHSHQEVMAYYRESIAWLIRTFDLKGFQIEQGDCGLCHCEKCRENRGVLILGGRNDFSIAAKRIAPLIRHALDIRPDLTIITETYAGLLPEEVEKIKADLDLYPDETTISWQAYNGWRNEFLITEESRSPKPHGCMAVRTNSDAAGGEREDSAGVEKAIRLAKNAGLDMTYIYGEYPDMWPITAKVYDTWATCSA